MLKFPFDPSEILRRKKALRRELLESNPPVTKRVAILGGSTTSEFKDCLELFLLSEGIKPEFYESDFDKFYEDGAFGNPRLDSFAPELVVFFTSSVNIRRWPEASSSEREVAVLLSEELSRFRAAWQGVHNRYRCTVIQNNFEAPQFRSLGNSDLVDVRGRAHFVNALNSALLEETRDKKYLQLHDLNLQAAKFGLDRWYDRQAWLSYRIAFSAEAMPAVAHSVAAVLKAIWGRSKKCLVLDLDNTLWGGVIGDDGVSGIKIGNGDPEGEAFLEFQDYVKRLHSRGVILSICSKNDLTNALSGLRHPNSLLRPEDFAAIRANWDPKSRNIADLAVELNIGLDSMVFIDDNPAEREIVRQELPQVSVPEVGSSVTDFIAHLEAARYFEALSVSAEDLSRTKLYKENAQRRELETSFQDYGTYLASLDMRGEIAPFSENHLDRIFQLANKTNQFNLTTKRYTRDELAALSASPDHVTLYGRLQDKFGDNGLVSLLIAKVSGKAADIELFLMSCRVLKRGLEQAMFDSLVALLQRRGVVSITGTYLPTAKNKMVENLLGELGFTLLKKADDGAVHWHLSIPNSYSVQNKHIRVSHEPEHIESGAGNIS